MRHEGFDVQAAMLYDVAPDFKIEEFMNWCAEWSERHKLDTSFSVTPGTIMGATLWIAGGGVHATVVVQPQPLDKDALLTALRLPVLRGKPFDFKSQIEAHRSGVIVTVGDGDLPVDAKTRSKMIASGLVQPADTEWKLVILNMVMQAVAAVKPPLMVEYNPSRSLLTPEDLAAVADMSLPLPILFRPTPVRNTPDEKGFERVGLSARNAEAFIGAPLELEAVPKDVTPAMSVEMLSFLFCSYHAGLLHLEHGDCFETEDGRRVWVRHELLSGESGQRKIIVSFDTPAPKLDAKARGEGQRAFQDRIARLKSRAKPGSTFDQPELATLEEPVVAASAGEDPEELRARIQETIDPGRHSAMARSGSSFGLPLKLIAATAILAAFVFTGGGQKLASLNAEGSSAALGIITDGLPQANSFSTGATTTATTDMVDGIRSSFHSAPQP